MSAIACDICGAPAVWHATADVPKSTETTSRFVCRNERHLISARETLGLCSIVGIGDPASTGRPGPQWA